MRIEARVTPEVLLWARKKAGYEVDEVVKRLKSKKVTAEVINAWEKNEAHLNEIQMTYPQLETLAKMYKRPLAVFFFPEPPEEANINQQLRSLPESYIQRLPPKILYLIRTALVKQIDLHELHGGIFPNDIQDFRSNIDNTDRESEKILATQMREIIGISLEEQKRWESPAIALKKWRKRLEDLGIWIFKEAFKSDNYCGFYLPNKQFPVIYLNNSMSKRRQIFTLFHELAHFLKDKGGVHFRKNVEDKFESIYKKEEIFCNAFAGSFLVPDDDFLVSSLPPDDVNIENYANEYKVSREVILRKYLNGRKITQEFYNDKIQQWKKEYEQYKKALREEQRRNPDKKKGGNYPRTVITYTGDKYLNLLFQQYYQQRINEYQLADYLGIKINNLYQIEESMLQGSI